MGGSRPIDENTIYRIYSMTKPITSVAAMMLFEEGTLRLDHEVYRYIPEFQDVMVLGEDGKLSKPARPMMVRDLFLHTSGLSYSFLMQGPVDEFYRKNQHRALRLEGRPEILLRSPRQSAARFLARRSLELLQLHRRARPRRRSRLGHEPRPVLPEAHLRPARHDRHRLPRSRRQPRSPDGLLSPQPGRRRHLARPMRAARTASTPRSRTCSPAAAALPPPSATT